MKGSLKRLRAVFHQGGRWHSRTVFWDGRRHESVRVVLSTGTRHVMFMIEGAVNDNTVECRFPRKDRIDTLTDREVIYRHCDRLGRVISTVTLTRLT